MTKMNCIACLTLSVVIVMIAYAQFFETNLF